MGTLKNSITDGDGNMAAFVGEAVVAEYLTAGNGCTVEWNNTYDYDITSDGVKIDVKTKRRNVPPLPHYDCQVPELNTTQKCDCYVFVSISYDNKTAWILGFMPKNEFYARAKFRAKGSYDGAWQVKSSCYYVPVSVLRPIEELKEWQKS